METNNSETQYSNADQLKKYADDLVKVYKSEQQKTKRPRKTPIYNLLNTAVILAVRS